MGRSSIGELLAGPPLAAGQIPATIEAADGTPGGPSRGGRGWAPWAAIDGEAEERAGRQVRRTSTWRERLYAFLVEFNKY
jgi:hypothetical protein